MEVNIVSVMLGTELAMQRMRKAGKSGQIINTASMAGVAPGLNEEMTPYTVSKHGVVALTRTLAKVRVKPFYPAPSQDPDIIRETER